MVRDAEYWDHEGHSHKKDLIISAVWIIFRATHSTAWIVLPRTSANMVEICLLTHHLFCSISILLQSISPFSHD
jgi:hypothetical protein